MIDGNNITQIWIDQEELVLSSKSMEWRIAIPECFVGFQYYVQHNMNKAIDYEAIQCIAITYIESGFPMVQFLNEEKTTLRFHKKWLVPYSGYRKKLAFVRMLNKCGFTTFDAT